MYREKFLTFVKSNRSLREITELRRILAPTRNTFAARSTGTRRVKPWRVMTRRDLCSHAPNAPLVSRSQQRSSSTCHSAPRLSRGNPSFERRTRGWKERRESGNGSVGRESPPIRHRRPDAASRASKLSSSRRRSEIVDRRALRGWRSQGWTTNPGEESGFFVTTGYCIVSFDRNEDTCAIGPIRVQDVARPFWGPGVSSSLSSARLWQFCGNQSVGCLSRTINNGLGLLLAFLWFIVCSLAIRAREQVTSWNIARC